MSASRREADDNYIQHKGVDSPPMLEGFVRMLALDGIGLIFKF
jgi:hypothetical protein